MSIKELSPDWIGLVSALKQLQQLHFDGFVFPAVWMLAERQIEARFARHNRLRMRKLTEAPFAVIGSHAGMSRSVEGYALHHHVNADFVDAAAPVLLRLHHTIRPMEVFCKQIQPTLEKTMGKNGRGVSQTGL